MNQKKIEVSHLSFLNGTTSSRQSEMTSWTISWWWWSWSSQKELASTSSCQLDMFGSSYSFLILFSINLSSYHLKIMLEWFGEVFETIFLKFHPSFNQSHDLFEWREGTETLDSCSCSLILPHIIRFYLNNLVDTSNIIIS